MFPFVRARSPRCCLLLPTAAHGRAPTLQLPLPWAVPQIGPRLGQGTQIVTLRCFSAGAWRDTSHYSTGKKAVHFSNCRQPVLLGLPSTGKGHPEACMGARRRRHKRRHSGLKVIRAPASSVGPFGVPSVPAGLLISLSLKELEKDRQEEGIEQLGVRGRKMKPVQLPQDERGGGSGPGKRAGTGEDTGGS